jgi:hypothetical protein
VTARTSAGCPQAITAQSIAQPDHKAGAPMEPIT